MKRTLIAALAVAAISGPALASDSLARSLGVDAGVYTTAQLVELKAAKADDNHVRIRQIMAEAEAGGFTGGGNGTAIAIASAQSDDDAIRVFGLQNKAEGGSNVTFSTRGGNDYPQLSASVGVAPGSLSLAELVELKNAQDGNDHDTVYRILASIN